MYFVRANKGVALIMGNSEPISLSSVRLSRFVRQHIHLGCVKELVYCGEQAGFGQSFASAPFRAPDGISVVWWEREHLPRLDRIGWAQCIVAIHYRSALTLWHQGLEGRYARLGGMAFQGELCCDIFALGLSHQAFASLGHG